MVIGGKSVKCLYKLGLACAIIVAIVKIRISTGIEKAKN